MKNTTMSKLIAGLITLSLVVGCGTQNSQTSSSEATPTQNSKLTLTYTIEGMDHAIDYYETPQKAVSLSSFTTEMMLALGLEENMIGTAYQDNEILPEYQAAYNSIPSLSPTNVSKEEMINIEPDFVTGWTSDFYERNHNPQFCEDNNIKLFIAQSEKDTATLADVYADFRSLGKIFDVEERAEEIISSMESEIEKIQALVPENGEEKRIFVYDSGLDIPLTVTGGLADDLITTAGGKNIFGGTETAWGQVSWEDVIARDPQYIILLKYAQSDDVSDRKNMLKQDPALKDVTAVKEDNIFELTLVDMLPGVRNAETIKIINNAIWGE